MHFDVPENMFRQLRQKQKKRGYSDDVTESENAILLDAGFGPACYLTSDGRVLMNEGAFASSMGTDHDGPTLVRPSQRTAVGMLVCGIRNLGYAELQALLPKRGPGAENCHACSDGWYPINKDGGGFICPVCVGLGWQSSYYEAGLLPPSAFL